MYFLIASETDPFIPWRQYIQTPYNGALRCGRADFFNLAPLRFPANTGVPDVVLGGPVIHTPNNNTVIVQPVAGPLNLVEANAGCRIAGVASPLYGYTGANDLGVHVVHPTAGSGLVDIYGHGTYGAHGGSGLSGLGGTIRKMELFDANPIRHALKILVYGKENLGRTGSCSDGTTGCVWPAIRSDSGYNQVNDPNYYGNNSSGLLMGSLVTLGPRPTTNCTTGTGLTGPLRTGPGRKLCQALQDYGAYVVDNTAFAAVGIAIERGAADELNSQGYSLVNPSIGHFELDTRVANSNSSNFVLDVKVLMASLMRVRNNGPLSVGGGAGDESSRRVKILLPEIGN